jgi:hypothetical protein
MGSNSNKPRKTLASPIAEAALSLEGCLSREDFATFIELNPHKPLPTDLRIHLVRLLRGTDRRKRGRPRSTAAWDFFLGDNIHVYRTKLLEFQQHKRLARSGESAHERALEFFREHLLEKMKKEPVQAQRVIRYVSIGRLRNIMSSLDWLQSRKRKNSA